MKTLLDLYQEGYIDYLVKVGIISPTITSYIQFYLEFNECRETGRTYRDSVKMLAQKHGVSETTVKKGIRFIQDAVGNQKVTLEESHS